MTATATETTAPAETAPTTGPEGTETAQAAETAPAETTAPETTDPAEGEGESEDARVKRANAQAAKYRTELRETQQQLQQQGEVLARLAAALNPEANAEQADPAQVAAEATQRVSTLESENSSLRAQLLVHELAGPAGADPVALLDSRRFTDALIQLDAGSDDYRDQVAAAIKSATESTPSLRAAGQVPSAGGAEAAGQGAGSGAAVTADQFAAMTYAQRTELFRTNPALYRQLAGTAT